MSYASSSSWPAWARSGRRWAQDAARDEASFADFLEKVLASELVLRDERRTSTLMKLATMPAVKTLEQFDWSCAGGAPKAQIQELAHLAFVQRAENVVLLGPQRRRQDRTSRWHLASGPCSPGTRFGSSARPT